MCDKYGVHLILDEIAVGFGRTGSFCLRTSGYNTGYIVPLKRHNRRIYAALRCHVPRRDLWDFYDSVEKAFLHSHSYSGNALGCATAANAVMDIFDDEKIIRGLAPKIAQIAAFADRLSHDKESKMQDKQAWWPLLGYKRKNDPLLEIFKRVKTRRVFKTLINTVYIMPPLVALITEACLRR